MYVTGGGVNRGCVQHRVHRAFVEVVVGGVVGKDVGA